MNQFVNEILQAMKILCSVEKILPSAKIYLFIIFPLELLASEYLPELHPFKHANMSWSATTVVQAVQQFGHNILGNDAGVSYI